MSVADNVRRDDIDDSLTKARLPPVGVNELAIVQEKPGFSRRFAVTSPLRNALAASSRSGIGSDIPRRATSFPVAHRPGRLEPRVLKRRRHGYKLMMKSRTELRNELRKH